MNPIAIELVKLIPSLLWFSLVVYALKLFYKPICNKLLPNLNTFKGMGVELSFVKDSIDAAVEMAGKGDALKLAKKAPQWNVEISSEDKKRVLDRVKKHIDIFRNVQILWLDDHPENNLNERKMFRQLKMEVDITKCTEEAIDMLKNGGYDLVVSDIDQRDNPTSGLDFLKQIRDEGKMIPVIFYIGVVDSKKGVPAQAFGITNRPDELLHLILDVLERKII